jgi:hypothetical protein
MQINSYMQSEIGIRRNKKARAQRYHLGISQLLELEAKQNSCCAICGKQETTKTLHVDHCHSTRIIRGLLCFKCNMLLGFAEDSPTILSNAIDYLKRAEANPWNPITSEVIRLAKLRGDERMAELFTEDMKPSYK